MGNGLKLELDKTTTCFKNLSSQKMLNLII